MMFQRNVMPAPSGSKNQPTKKPEEAGGKLRIYAPLKHQAVSELQNAMTQKTKLFVATAVITLHPAYLIFLFQEYFHCKD
jgi:hypothetical protein